MESAVISRRSFLTGAAIATGALIVPELIAPKRAFFLPPKGGWDWQAYAYGWHPYPTAYPNHAAISIVSTTPGAQIYYTLDGTTPNEHSAPYTEPLPITETFNLRAIAYKIGRTL